MQDTGYLGELGGLSGRRRLIMFDLRGTGESATPEDAASYRCDRLVDDVEALRVHLGLDRLDLLAHSAGANLAVLYAARYPDRIGKLVLITPSTMAVDLSATDADRRETALLRRDEPWFPTAFAALEAIQAGTATADTWSALTPFFYGRWDAAARAHDAAQEGHRNDEAAAGFRAEGAYDPPATRAALSTLTAPVLLLAGQVDLNPTAGVVAEFAALFPKAEFVAQPGAGHMPWVDDADRFVATTASFLG
jgi:pimeloyl-ACP methyl ester carboxylesterase